MHAEHPNTDDIEYGRTPAALLAGADPTLLESVADLVGGAGLRIAGRLPLAELAGRLERQAALGLLWLECGEAADTLDLAPVAEAAERGTPVVAAIRGDSIDRFAAALPQGNAIILVDADPVARAAAIAEALAVRAAPARVSDVGRDNAVRLRQLSDEVGRIAASLARLSALPPEGSTRPAPTPVDGSGTPEVDGEKVRAIIRARRLRARFFDPQLFADPAWDMLLDLLQAEIAQHRVPVSSLCIAAAVPATTALRWIKSMTDAGLFVRRADPHDARRVFVELSPAASAAMRRYFAEAGEVAGL